MKILLLIMALIFTTQLWAIALSPALDLNTARVAPKRISSVRWKGVFFQGTRRFNDSRDIEPMSALFNKTLTFRDMVGIDDPTSDPAERGGLLGVLKEWGHSLDEEVGKVTGDLKLGVSTSVPILVHGITDNFTLAVALPIFKYKINVDSGFVAYEPLKKLAKKFKEEKKFYALNELMKVNRPTSEAVKMYNYEAFENQEGQMLGDIVTVLKYRLINQPQHALALQTDLTFPTGKEKDINKIISFPAGDGQTDIGISAIYDFYFSEENYITTTVKYVAELPDHSEERIPFMSDSPLSPEKDPNVSRNLGDHVHFQLGGQYAPLKGIQARGAYNFHYKGADRYKGNLFAPIRYSWLGKDTEQFVHTYMLGLSVSNIPWVRVSRNFLPIEVNFNYLGYLAGKNTVRNPIFSFELATYF